MVLESCSLASQLVYVQLAYSFDRRHQHHDLVGMCGSAVTDLMYRLNRAVTAFYK